MNNLIGVENHQRIKNALKNRSCILLSVLPSLLDLIKEFLSVKMLQY